MREIKFRGKGIEVDVKDKWIYGDLIHCDSTHYGNQFFIKEILLDDESDEWLVDYGTVGQYTGEKDYNETKIYEDDIGLIDGYRYRVIFYKCRWSFQLLVGNHTIYPPNFYEHTKNFKIIGNAFDNPELLEEVDDSH